ncbi:2-hydroxyacid dehydrogenase [Acidocella sp.]|uniref:2-hydroxyacid dehydrogenase n=1 Tax=Acidocella sp. TaxID=50710 RepID=UPI003D03BD3A
MSFLFKYGTEEGQIWARAFAEALPGISFKLWPDIGKPEEVRFLLFYEPIEDLSIFPNLEILFTMSAGVEQALRLSLPAHLKLVRMVEPGLTASMVEYVVGSVLALHREFPKYLTRQTKKIWQDDPVPRAGERRVSVMGAGVLGVACLEALKPFGFPLSVWSRSRKNIENVDCHAGMEELWRFLARTDILICLLPLTSSTRNILNARTFGGLPRGASLINAGRGGHLVESDLLAALETGQLDHAILDVCAEEPLPGTSLLWDHPQVWITPHIASNTQAGTGADAVIQNIKNYLNNLPLTGLVNREQGY